MPISEKRRAQLMGGPYTRLLAEHEAAMADFYNTIAEALKDSETFWLNISKEELEHQRMIEDIDEKFQNSNWKFKRPDFVTSAIIDSLGWIAARKSKVQTDGISMREALKTAVELETSMLERNFFHIVDDDSPRMIEVLETQAAYTKAHIKRIQMEAGRLKWKIMGGRKSLPNTPKPQSSRETLHANVKAAQANMLGMLIAMEEATSRLYNTYSEKLGDSSRFWARLGTEETQHGLMLRQLYKILDDGKVFYNVEHFNRKALEEMIEFIMNSEFEARHGNLSQNEALSIALKIERSMVESGFYSIVTSDAPEFQIIAKRLVELTKVHTAKLETEVTRSANHRASAKKHL